MRKRTGNRLSLVRPASVFLEGTLMDDKMRRMLAELRIAQRILRQDMERPSPWRWFFMLAGSAIVLIGLRDLL